MEPKKTYSWAVVFCLVVLALFSFKALYSLVSPVQEPVDTRPPLSTFFMGTTSQTDSIDVQHLEDRIADCQNEIYAANNSVWQLNFEITQYRSAGDPISILKNQPQVQSEFGKTLCFEDGDTQYKQSDELNNAQQNEFGS